MRKMLSEIKMRIFNRLILGLANGVTISVGVPFSGVKASFLRILGIKISSPVFIDSGFDCRYPRNISIGRNCSFGHYARIWAFHRVEIGDYVQTALGLTIVSGGHSVSDYAPLTASQEVVIEGENWIGANVTIIGGVTIGRGSVIGAGSVVVRSIPPWSVAVGNPARVIRQRQPAEQIVSPFGLYTSSGRL